MSANQPDRPTTPDLAALLRTISANPTPARHRASTMPEMPTFPSGIFPKPVAAWLGPAATAARIHPECVAIPFLALTGALVGNRATLDVGLGWIEYPLLWIALVAPSGGGKTPALPTALKPTLEQRVLRILAETAEPEGWLSRTNLYLLAGRPPRKDLTAALSSLIAKRAIESHTERQPNAGRPLTAYRLK